MFCRSCVVSLLTVCLAMLPSCNRPEGGPAEGPAGDAPTDQESPQAGTQAQQEDGTEAEAGQQQTSPLVGQPAPNIESELLDGESFVLEDRYADEIVILDFWATWCGPCIQELPVLMEVADEYASRGVALYAVNQGEDEETIRNFLDRQDWELQVVLDQQQTAGRAYNVTGIPMLALIDREGVVQNVHVGYSPDIGDVLRQELDQLLAGEDQTRKREAAGATLGLASRDIQSRFSDRPLTPPTSLLRPATQ